MRLYQHPMSANSRAATLAALQLKAPVELVFVDLAKGEQRLPAYLKLNPNHRVPVLEDGDFHLWESRAIMQYLADKTPGQTGLSDRGACARGCESLAVLVRPALRALDQHFFLGERGEAHGRPGGPGSGRVAARRAAVQRVRRGAGSTSHRPQVGLRSGLDTGGPVDRRRVGMCRARQGAGRLVRQHQKMFHAHPGVGSLATDRADGARGRGLRAQRNARARPAPGCLSCRPDRRPAARLAHRPQDDESRRPR